MRKRSLFSIGHTPAVFASLWICSVAGATPTPATAPAEAAKAARPVAGDATVSESGRLAVLAGRWAVRQSMWTDPSRPPVIDQGTATFTPVLGGRHLRQDLRIDAAKPFQGLGYLGYDDAAGSYDSLWMDVNFSGVILAHGSYDPVRRAYTFVGSVPDPKVRGAMSPLREVMSMKDADHFTFDYYERHAGKEQRVVRLEYARTE